MTSLSDNVKADIRAFLDLNWTDFLKDAKEYDGYGVYTFATNESGDEWSYQTGDNSFTGGCYCHPHWVVDTIAANPDYCAVDCANYIIDQLEELLAGY